MSNFFTSFLNLIRRYRLSSWDGLRPLHCPTFNVNYPSIRTKLSTTRGRPNPAVCHCVPPLIILWSLGLLTKRLTVHAVWKYQYRSQCLVPVVEEAFGAKSPSYATILKLDRKIRDFDIPSSLQLSIPLEGDTSSVSFSLSMQRYMLFCEKETSM